VQSKRSSVVHASPSVDKNANNLPVVPIRFQQCVVCSRSAFRTSASDGIQQFITPTWVPTYL